MLACSVGRIVRSMSVIRDHSVPEGAPCLAQAAAESVSERSKECTTAYELAAMGGGLATADDAVVEGKEGRSTGQQSRIEFDLGACNSVG
jgi:hypothetical protein